MLSPWQRWAIRLGVRAARSAVLAESDGHDTFDSVDAALLKSLDDATTQFCGSCLLARYRARCAATSTSTATC